MKSEKCYAYDPKLDICLIYGGICNAKDEETNACYHTKVEKVTESVKKRIALVVQGQMQGV